MYFTSYLRRLKFHRTYFGYALAAGVSSLIIPLGTQFLVNNLALANIWTNTATFLILIGAVLALAQVFRHTQVVLVEYLQREILVHELNKWRDLSNTKNSPYYFEIHNLLKSFSKTYTDLIDMILVSFFGLIVIVSFHPVFLVLPIILIILSYLVRRDFVPAYKSSIEESNKKYDLYFLIARGEAPTTDMTFDYIDIRDRHFRFVRSISRKVSFLHALVPFIVLAVGAYLIQLDQLSVGQLVASELIVTGIMQSLQKLPNALEALYDFETSHYKIDKALGPVGDYAK